MRLIDKQRIFTGDWASLIEYAQWDCGYFVVGKETLRAEVAAEWNANHCRRVIRGDRCEKSRASFESGCSDCRTFKAIGIRNSLHAIGLAGDLLIFEDGGRSISNDRAKYARLGLFWKSIRPGNRWGGDFSGFADLGHFSREHNGRQ